MRSVRVVVGHPAIELGLGGLAEANVRPSRNSRRRLVEALDLAGGSVIGRCAMGDPVLAQDPIEQHLDGIGAEAPREALAALREDLIGDPVAGERVTKAPGTPPRTSPW
jgi:hypothetical protein